MTIAIEVAHIGRQIVEAERLIEDKTIVAVVEIHFRPAQVVYKPIPVQVGKEPGHAAPDRM